MYLTVFKDSFQLYWFTAYHKHLLICGHSSVLLTKLNSTHFTLLSFLYCFCSVLRLGVTELRIPKDYILAVSAYFIPEFAVKNDKKPQLKWSGLWSEIRRQVLPNTKQEFHPHSINILSVPNVSENLKFRLKEMSTWNKKQHKG
jgi:hypothetical protein